jgi:hypothetical protein
MMLIGSRGNGSMNVEKQDGWLVKRRRTTASSVGHLFFLDTTTKLYCPVCHRLSSPFHLHVSSSCRALLCGPWQRTDVFHLWISPNGAAADRFKT